MKKLLTLFCLLASFGLSAQVTYTAQNFINPYTGSFRPGTNLDYYPNWTTRQLGEISAGNPAIGVKGVGSKTLRPVLAESVLEVYGYDLLVDDFEHFRSLGMDEFTAVLAFPVDWHRDYTEYCPGRSSNLFANLYTPIWDGGANGTPYNDDNYFAAYVYKTVTMYDDYVKFWEIWNEPGFDYTGNTGWRDAGDPQGNWWDNDPNPCDYILQAPIENYVRTLRIAYEVIKTISPDDYVAVAGFGYQSFLDAVLRNTDNPNGGGVTEQYPFGGGAYFDIMGLHNYPHFDGTTFLQNINFYERHSDRAAEGLVYRRDFFQEIFDNYGYDGVTYPKKLTICTEMNIPREFPSNNGTYLASTEAQRNYIMKTFVSAITNDVINWYVYSIGDDNPGQGFGFSEMGLYKNLYNTNPYSQQYNDEGIAMKTTSDMIYGNTYDYTRTAALNAPAGVEAHAFQRPDGSYVYMLWARTQIDLSEFASATYSFPASFGYTTLDRINWDYTVTNVVQQQSANGIQLNATPIFLLEDGITSNFLTLNCPANISINVPPGSTGADVSWNEPTASTDCTSGSVTINQSSGNGNGTFFPLGTSTVTYNASNGCGQTDFCSFTITVTVEDDPGQNGYCSTGGDAPWEEWISNVNFQEIDNASGKCDPICGYGNFVNLTANVNKGGAHPITLTPGLSWAGHQADLYWSIWIDLNNDGDFDDAGEMVFQEYGNNQVVNGVVSIPADAQAGTTRMRISAKRGAYATACESFDRGEVEDYTVNIGDGGTGCTAGTPCNDGDECTTNDVYDADCNCAGTFSDNDNDGVCTASDCDDNNAALPATPGTACDDGNATTFNDEILADGCTCMGTPDTPTSDCPTYTVDNGTITVSGINVARTKVRLWSTNGAWNQVFICEFDCNNPTVISGLNGNYHLKIDAFDQNWNYICELADDLVIGGGTCTDNDNDGICAPQDCDDNNPSLPAPAGTACDDGNANTVNDAIQADGCTCMGQPVTGGGDCANISVSGSTMTITMDNPINIVKVFDQNWLFVYDCAGDCPNPIVIENLTNQTYNVKVDGYDANWNFQCNINEFVTVTTASAALHSENSSAHIDLPMDIYPNPTTGSFQVNAMQFADQQGDLLIYDTNGKVIKQISVENFGLGAINVDLSNQTNGLYFVVARTKKGKVQTSRVVVEAE